MPWTPAQAQVRPRSSPRTGVCARSFYGPGRPQLSLPDWSAWADGDTVFMTCTVWRQMAEAVAESLVRGTRVIVTGRLKQRSYEAKDGSGKRTVYEVEADDVAVSLKFATAKISKSERSRPAAGSGSRGQAEADPWVTDGQGGYSSEPPF